MLWGKRRGGSAFNSVPCGPRTENYKTNSAKSAVIRQLALFAPVGMLPFVRQTGSVSVGDNREMVGPAALGGSGLSSNADGLHGHITAAQRSHWFLLCGIPERATGEVGELFLLELDGAAGAKRIPFGQLDWRANSQMHVVDDLRIKACQAAPRVAPTQVGLGQRP